MTIYIYTLIFFIPLLTYIYQYTKNIGIENDKLYEFISLFLILISSFRWQVGGDWQTYNIIYETIDITSINFRWSFLFSFINYFFSILQLGIFGVNFFVSSIFFLALYRLGKLLNFDLLLILIISISLIYFNGIMGYVRQSISLTLLIFSIVYIFEDKKFFSLVFFILSILNHKTAIIFFPIYIFIFYKNLIFIFLTISIMILGLIFALDTLLISFNEFIIKGFVSNGAIFRSIPLFICCIFYIYFRKKILFKSKHVKVIIDYMCFLSIILVLTTFLFKDWSAFSDRLIFYMSIFQIMVIGVIFSQVIKINNRLYLHSTILVSAGYFFITYSWFLFGDYSIYWLDYNFLYKD
jgi:hypothetical protein